MILLRATANSQPLICSMGSVSTVVVSWYQTSCKISSASASLLTRWRMKPSSRLPKRLMTDAIFFPGDEGIRGLMVKMSSILTRKTGEWREYFKKVKKSRSSLLGDAEGTSLISWLTTLWGNHVLQEKLLN